MNVLWLQLVDLCPPWLRFWIFHSSSRLLQGRYPRIFLCSKCNCMPDNWPYLVFGVLRSNLLSNVTVFHHRYLLSSDSYRSWGNAMEGRGGSGWVLRRGSSPEGGEHGTGSPRQWSWHWACWGSRNTWTTQTVCSLGGPMWSQELDSMIVPTQDILRFYEYTVDTVMSADLFQF